MQRAWVVPERKKIQGDNLSFRAEEEPAVKNKWLKNKGGHKCPEPCMERSLLSPMLKRVGGRREEHEHE